jgi:CRP-like cAMP-binding protein
MSLTVPRVAATIGPDTVFQGRRMARLDQIAFLKDAGIDLSPFETRCRWRRFDTDEILVDFDDVSTDVYLILSGDVRILIRTQSGKEVILGEMRGGQMFGELAAIDGVSRSANVTALTRGEACVMPATVFREIVFAAPAIADRLLRLLTKRVRELNARLMEHAVLDLRHRLYSELLRLSVPRAGSGAGTANERVVTPPPYHHVLAARIGCRREQVTREFTTMSQEGLVERTRGALVLKRPDVFEKRIAEAMREEGG